ncbi:acyl-CoA dehydrogenase family protein [Actinomadura sp. KC216]|uniref:acyl-CoA dehydrogenase family protein n=1 Tax=Actinomadura sp. KC216 TaxID=2530370 RepID=UPI00140554F9|nr:acyl-CoA dehydrogenase family protein [Actinomadura sp. KC216]
MTDHDELLDRARRMVPVLEERAQDAEQRRELPEATVKELVDAEFHRILLPPERGGFGLGLETAFAVGGELARGCTSTAWVATIYMIHNWMAAMLPERAQREVFGGAGPVLPAGTLAPTGTARQVDGGYVLSGRWRWGSGIQHGTHALVAAQIELPESAIERRMFLVDAADLVVHDVWFTSGMLATGSNDIEAREVFVPAWRTLLTSGLLTGVTAGTELYDLPTYRMPVIPAIAFSAAAPALGTAEALLGSFENLMRTRRLAYSGAPYSEVVGAQLRLAKATAELRAARLLFDDTVRWVQDTYAGGAALDLDGRARCRLIAAHVTDVAASAINLLAEASGASSQFLHSPFQRAQRDVNTIKSHLVCDVDGARELYGKVRMGLDLVPGTLV